jgi:serine/threonine protein kinase
MRTTRYSRGTPSFRAPELLHEDAKFNNKIDIWAMGCILYEIIFRKKAFSNDFAVLSYAHGLPGLGDLQIPDPPNLPFDWLSIETILRQTLAVDPKARPSAQQLVQRFKSSFRKPKLTIDNSQTQLSSNIEEAVDSNADEATERVTEGNYSKEDSG